MSDTFDHVLGLFDPGSKEGDMTDAELVEAVKSRLFRFSTHPIGLDDKNVIKYLAAELAKANPRAVLEAALEAKGGRHENPV